MTILPKDRNKILKRINNNKSSSEFQNKLVLLFIENLIPFQNIERNQFQWLISQQFDVPKYINSNAEIMKKKSHRLYLDYQTYLVSYVRSQDELKVSLQIHKWKSHNEINPFLFFSMSFINSEFKLCDYPLGIVDFEDTSIANIFGRGNGGNNLLNSVLGKVSFVTTNFAVSSTISEILQSDGINESNVLQCLLPILMT